MNRLSCMFTQDAWRQLAEEPALREEKEKALRQRCYRRGHILTAGR